MLTTDQIEAFHRDGLLVVRGVLDGEEVDELRAAVDATTRRGIAHDGEGHWYEEIDGEERYFRTDGIFDDDPVYRRFALRPDLLTIVGQLIGHPFLPINDTIVVKLPHSGVPIPWHQDPPYAGETPRSTTFGVPNFDIDIYLDETTTANGCLYGIAGHHLVGAVDFGGRSEDELFELSAARPIEMAPGDVLVHCMSAPHGSRGNDSAAIRRVVYFHYMAREVLTELYGEWGTRRPMYLDPSLRRGDAFTPAGIEVVRRMIAEAGLVDQLDAAGIELTGEGLELTRGPRTGPRHWAELRQVQTDGEVAARRALAGG